MMTGAELRHRLDYLRGLGRPDRAWDLAVVKLETGTSDEVDAARFFLPALASSMPASAWSGHRSAQARRHAVSFSDQSRSETGRVCFPTVDGERSRFVRAEVARLPGARQDHLPPGLHPSSAGSTRDALAAVRSLTGADTFFSVSFDCNTDAFEGRSCGLAIALAAFSCLQNLSVRESLSATGDVHVDGHVADVDCVHEKLALRDEARPRSRMLVSANFPQHSPEIQRVPTLREAVTALGAGQHVDLQHRFAPIQQDYRNGQWAKAAEAADRLLHLDDDLGTDIRLQLLTFKLAAATHTGRAEVARELSAELLLLCEASDHGEAAAEAFGFCATSALDAFEVASAREILAITSRLHWNNTASVFLRGAEALLAVVEGRFDDAVAHRRSNVQQAPAHERPRCMGDLADAYRRCGRHQEARTVIDEALAMRPRRYVGYLHATRTFLHLHAARIYRALGLEDEARALLDGALFAEEPDPSFRLELERALLQGDRREVEAAWHRMPKWCQDSTIFKALYARARHQAGDPSAGAELAALMKQPGLPADELCRRLPY